jgi:hypothetical protein
MGAAGAAPILAGPSWASSQRASAPAHPPDGATTHSVSRATLGEGDLSGPEGAAGAAGAASSQDALRGRPRPRPCTSRLQRASAPAHPPDGMDAFSVFRATLGEGALSGPAGAPGAAGAAPSQGTLREGPRLRPRAGPLVYALICSAPLMTWPDLCRNGSPDIPKIALRGRVLSRAHHLVEGPHGLATPCMSMQAAMKAEPSQTKLIQIAEALRRGPAEATAYGCRNFWRKRASCTGPPGTLCPTPSRYAVYSQCLLHSHCPARQWLSKTHDTIKHMEPARSRIKLHGAHVYASHTIPQCPHRTPVRRRKRRKRAPRHVDTRSPYASRLTPYHWHTTNILWIRGRLPWIIPGRHA